MHMAAIFLSLIYHRVHPYKVVGSFICNNHPYCYFPGRKTENHLPFDQAHKKATKRFILVINCPHRMLLDSDSIANAEFYICIGSGVHPVLLVPAKR